MTQSNLGEDADTVTIKNLWNRAPWPGAEGAGRDA